MDTETREPDQIPLGGAGGVESTANRQPDPNPISASSASSANGNGADSDGASSAEPAKRRHRRTREQIMADESATAQTSFGLGTVTPPKAKSHHSPNEKKPAPATAATLKNEQAKKTADKLIAVAESLAIAFAGPEAALKDAERFLIEDSLPETLATLTPAAAAQIQQYAAPAMLGTGLILYSVRVFGLVANKAKAERETARARAAMPANTAPENESQPGPGDGAGLAATPNIGPDVLASVDGRKFITPRGVDA